MKLNSFRIQSYRSILDSNWCPFSADNVNAIVGQNESGKTSVLEALHCFADHPPTLNRADIRSGGSLPLVSLKVELSKAELAAITKKMGAPPVFTRLVDDAFSRTNGQVIVSAVFTSSDSGKFELDFQIESPAIIPGMPSELRETLSDSDREDRLNLEKADRDFGDELISAVPNFSLFKEENARLPDEINLDGSTAISDKDGETGGNNFLKAVGLNISDLLSADVRLRATLIKRANAFINKELDSYWSQFLGGKKKIAIEAEFGRKPPDHPESPGMAYLTFWVSEGDERFYPSQRSRGTRWFVSVFLHLLATEKESRNYVVMLDEPGSFLHPTAQDDVKRLIQRIAQKCPVIYSTHSPDLVDFSKPYRILAAERSGNGDLSDTEIYQAFNLACASKETLTPILLKMGADMRHQTVIRRAGNVILEEPSAHFYLQAFAKMLFPQGVDLSFIACSGVNNVPDMFAILMAWGLKPVVLIDDDKQGREVRKGLIKNYFGDVPDNALNTIFRLENKDGVEDCFTEDEFFDVILEGAYKRPANTNLNSTFMKDAKISKPVTAYQLFMQVEKGLVTAKNFSDETVSYFTNLIERLVAGSH